MNYQNQSNYFAFLPMLLACDERYQKLSARGCYLYSLMLSRANLSQKNMERFSDENGVFIYFSLEEMGKYLNCSRHTAILTVQELISAELVKREDCKNGKSPKYYVKQLGNNQPVVQQKQEKEVSFDVELAERRAREKLIDFGTKKNKRRRKQESSPSGF